MKKILNVIMIALILFSIISLTGCNNDNYNDKQVIISTSFPGFDFARAITRNKLLRRKSNHQQKGRRFRRFLRNRLPSLYL